MTPNEKTIQDQRREIVRLKAENERLEKQHTLDLTDLVRLRRMFEVEKGGVLSGLKIKEEIRAGRISITDFNDRRINPNSYNVRLHNELLVYETDRFDPETGEMHRASYGPLDMKRNNPYYRIKIPESGYLLQPGRLYLGQTMEHTKTDCYVPIFDGRSSVGRLGISVHATAGFGDVGFVGYWTLEIFCVQPVIIYPGVEIGQLYYQTIVGDYQRYSSGKYQDNSGVQPSKMYRDFEPKEVTS